ncbi:MAG TPA: acyl-CoA dehydrogenase, partial [Stellaceae bacterium]|nr:acyl-CoA dehydrogenase [Stellaceae bacterium]
MPYAAPLDDMRFVMDVVAPAAARAGADIVDAVLAEAGKFAAAELDPLNQTGDRIGSVLENGVVRTPPG